jgi:hypothetical protein
VDSDLEGQFHSSLGNVHDKKERKNGWIDTSLSPADPADSESQGSVKMISVIQFSVIQIQRGT